MATKYQSSDDAEKCQEPVADFPHLLTGNQYGKYGHIDGHAAELEGKNLPAVVAVVRKPEQLLENFTQHQHYGKNAHNLPVQGRIVLHGEPLADPESEQDHQSNPENMKPGEHSRSHISGIDIAPCPVEKNRHK